MGNSHATMNGTSRSAFEMPQRKFQAFQAPHLPEQLRHPRFSVEAGVEFRDGFCVTQVEGAEPKRIISRPRYRYDALRVATHMVLSAIKEEREVRGIVAVVRGGLELAGAMSNVFGALEQHPKYGPQFRVASRRIVTFSLQRYDHPAGGSGGIRPIPEEIMAPNAVLEDCQERNVIPGDGWFVAEDLRDKGPTLEAIEKKLPGARIGVLYCKHGVLPDTLQQITYAEEFGNDWLDQPDEVFRRNLQSFLAPMVAAVDGTYLPPTLVQ
jgi:hypothetical protein